MPEPESIKRPIILDAEEARTKEILLLQPTYLLDENNFNKLIKGSTGFKDWSQKILFMSIGWAFKLTSALIVFLIAYHSSKSGEKVNIEIKSWEIVSVVLALLVCLILYCVGSYVKNDKDKLIESIKKHFESHKK